MSDSALLLMMVNEQQRNRELLLILWGAALVVGVALFLLARLRVAQKAGEANAAARTQFLANMSHENWREN